MRVSFASVGYLIVLFSAYRWSYSTSGFLVLGLGPIVLLDKYIFHLLPWTEPVAWTKELWVRGGCFVIGSVAAYLVRYGLVPISEALAMGVFLSLSALLFESISEFVLQMTRRLRRPHKAGQPKTRLKVCCSALGFLALIGLAAPLESVHPLRTVPKRTPAVVGLGFEEVRFVTSDGVQLAGWLVPHAQARGNVIFCHGHGRNREHGMGFLPTLHELRLNVLAFDFRGHGDSAGHTATFGQREVQDVVAAEAYLRRRFPNKPIFIVGVSYGAAVALQALPQLTNVRGVWSEGCFSRLMPVVTNQFSWVPSCLRDPLVSSYKVSAWLDCGLWGPDINPVEHLRDVDVPISFCHAVEDELVPFAEAEVLYNSYGGPKWNYWIERAKHCDLRRRNKSDYLRRLREFFEASLNRNP